MGMTPILILHCQLAPEGDAILQVPFGMNGMAFVTGKGSEVLLGGQDDESSHLLKEQEVGTQMVLLPPGGQSLRCRNPSKNVNAEFMIFLGHPVRKPYCKYVGYGGAMVHANRQLCEDAMSRYEKDPQNFGRSPASDPVDISARYKMIPGFYNKNGTGLEREDGVMARFEEADDFVPGS